MDAYHNLLNEIENIKNKISDNEYLTILNSINNIYKINNNSMNTIHNLAYIVMHIIDNIEHRVEYYSYYLQDTIDYINNSILRYVSTPDEIDNKIDILQFKLNNNTYISQIDRDTYYPHKIISTNDKKHIYVILGAKK